LPNSHASLTDRLGPTFTAALTSGTAGPADPRLAFALRIFRMIEAKEGGDVARAWMIGGNPMLGEDTPITAIRERRFSEVEATAANHLER